MLFLLLLLGVMAVAAGVFGLGVGLPVRDTTFGAAVLVSASVAITGGLILVGLAAAVSELRRGLQAGMRHVRPERWETERGAGVRRMEPRLGASGAHAGKPATLDKTLGGMLGGAASNEAADVIPTRFDAPEAMERPRKPAREERFPSDAGSARGPAAAPPEAEPVPLGAGAEPHHAAAAPAVERFDSVRPSDYRKPDAAPQPRTEAPPGAGEDTSLPPGEPAGPAAIRPVRVLKSGVINDVSYTLFSDGSIETQTPEGTQRFGSIDEFRRHLEKSA